MGYHADESAYALTETQRERLRARVERARIERASRPPAPPLIEWPVYTDEEREVVREGRAWLDGLEGSDERELLATRHAAIDAVHRARAAFLSRQAAQLLVGLCALGLLALASGLGGVAAVCAGAVVTVASWWVASVGQSAVRAHRAHERVDGELLPGARRVVVGTVSVDARAGEHSRSVAGSDGGGEGEQCT